jgi:hypothetical protein
MTVVTQPQRNILRFMLWSKWMHIGAAVLFALIPVLQGMVAGPESLQLHDYIWAFTSVVFAFCELMTFVVMTQWRDIFAEHIDG